MSRAWTSPSLLPSGKSRLEGALKGERSRRSAFTGLRVQTTSWRRLHRTSRTKTLRTSLGMPPSMLRSHRAWKNPSQPSQACTSPGSSGSRAAHRRFLAHRPSWPTLAELLVICKSAGWDPVTSGCTSDIPTTGCTDGNGIRTVQSSTLSDRVDRDLVVELLGDRRRQSVCVAWMIPRRAPNAHNSSPRRRLPVGILQSEASDRRRTLVVRPSGILARLPWGLLELPDGVASHGALESADWPSAWSPHSPALHDSRPIREAQVDPMGGGRGCHSA